MQLDATTYIAIGLVVIFLGVFIVFRLRMKKSGASKSKAGGKQHKDVTKEQNKKIPSSIRNSIPYIHTFDNGIIETDPGVFTRAYSLSDINFKIAPDEEQTSIFIKYGRLLNAFSPDVNFQIVIQNRNADKQSFFHTVQFTPQSDNLNGYRREMNDILLNKMAEGRNNLSQEKMLVVSVKAKSYDDALQKLNDLDKIVMQRFRDISRAHPARMMTLSERLYNLFYTYNQDGTGYFYNAKNKEGEQVFDIATMMHMGLSTKDVVGPAGMEFTNGYFIINNTYGRTLYLENLPSYLSTDFLSDISDLSSNLIISLNYQQIEQQKAAKMVHNMMLSIDGQIADRQKRAAQDGYSADLVSGDLVRQQSYARELINDMVARDQKMYYVTLSVTVFGHSLNELEELTRQISAIAENHMCSLKTLYFQQEAGLNSTLPLCRNELLVSKMLTTESASIFIPYTTQELHQKDGLYYGINDTSHNLIVYNRLFGENFNGLIFGESGNGKSFAAKQEMMSALLKSPNNVVYVIDPESEYSPLCRALGGEVVDLSPGSASYLNPLDMDIKYGDEADPVSMKAEFIISMIEIMIGNGRIITPEEKSIISRCVQNIYRPYLNAIDDANRAGQNITRDNNSAPTLQTLYNAIAIQPEPAARSIASTLEMYATGTLATFAHRTNINVNSRFVVYDIKNLGTGTKDLGIHVCVNDVWNRMIENKKKGIFTWIYIDEFYLLLQSESSAKFIASIWKRARKWNGVPTGILQNTEDILRTTDSRAILNNSSFVQMLSLKKIDRANLGELLSISESQQEYITDAGPGHGLIYAGKTILPFKNDFPEDTKLFSVLNTSYKKS